jgi:hypothetical protein
MLTGGLLHNPGWVSHSGNSMTELTAGETSSTRSIFGNGLVEQQELILVGRLKDRCPILKVSPCHW